MNFTEKIIKCRSCEKDLYSMLLFEVDLPSIWNGRDPVQLTAQIIDAFCPFCGDQAWKQTVNKKVMLSPADGLVFQNIDQNIEDTNLNMRIEIGKL